MDLAKPKTAFEWFFLQCPSQPVSSKGKGSALANDNARMCQKLSGRGAECGFNSEVTGCIQSTDKNVKKVLEGHFSELK